MGQGLRDAIASCTATGELFEVVEHRGAGVSRRVFKNSPATLRDIFNSARGSSETFLVYEDEEWSFGDVMVAVDEFADALVHHFGVQRGDRVGVAMRNNPQWVVAFAAIVSVGAISVSLNASWTADEFEFALNDAQPKVLVADATTAARALKVCRRHEVPLLLARGDVTDIAPLGASHWVDIVRHGASMPSVELSSDDDATILYTSGTTGRAKGAVSTHGAICQSLMAFSAGRVIEGMRSGANDHPPRDPTCFILIVPLFHVTGCVPVMLSCFSWHFKLVMMPRWDPEGALRLIEKHRVTNVAGVPTQSWDLVNQANFTTYDTSSLVTVGGGGAPAPVSLVARVQASYEFARPNLAYGMTETNAYGPQNYGDDYQSHPTSTGQTPTAVMDVEIRDAGARVLGPGEVGEIWLSGPTLFRAYWRQPGATKETLVNGWLRTGDVGRLDEEGFLYIEDRLKDMILRGGENVYCAEVESAIFEHPAVLEAAVCARADERLGESVAAVVVLRGGATLSESELNEFLALRLAKYKIPTSVIFTAERLVTNGAGKVSKRDMAKRYFDSTP